MACTSFGLSSASPVGPVATKDVHRHHDGLRRSNSASELRCDRAGIRRSRSEPQLRWSMTAGRAAATEPTRMKTSRAIAMFPFSLSSFIRSFLFDSEDESGKGMLLVEPDEGELEPGPDEAETEKRVNWVDRVLELRNRWRDRQQKEEKPEEKEEEKEIGECACGCGVSYGTDEEGEEEPKWDMESFSKLLAPVGWSDTKLFSKLAFLCNKAYVIPEIKSEDLGKQYGFQLVTSSLVRKAEAATKAKLESDSTGPLHGLSAPNGAESQQKRLLRTSVAHDIAASAASYVRSRAKDLLALGSGPGPENNQMDPTDLCGEQMEGEPPIAAASPGRKVYNSEVAASVAASTMTAVVAAEEEAKQEAAKDLRSLHSAPCEWFVCDDPTNYIRCFIIQGSDSLASWQTNLFFEPTKFEGMEAIVHRGIYEAAKGIYEQFMPEIEKHLRRHGERAKLRFTGHSLGGSLALLVSLMLLTRKAVPRYSILPVITFGSPSIFCGGERVLEGLRLDEGFVCSIMMHRDIVPRAFSCNYPNHVAQVLKRLNGAFRSHPCLSNDKLLYSPMGQQFILLPDEKSSPSHPLIPPGPALYTLNGKGNGASKAVVASALKAFLNSPHPLDTLSDPKAYGSEGTILRDHDSSNYLKAINKVVRQNRSVVQCWMPHQCWPLLATPMGLPGLAWSIHREPGSLENAELVATEMVTGV